MRWPEKGMTSRRRSWASGKVDVAPSAFAHSHGCGFTRVAPLGPDNLTPGAAMWRRIPDHLTFGNAALAARTFGRVCRQSTHLSDVRIRYASFQKSIRSIACCSMVVLARMRDERCRDGDLAAQDSIRESMRSAG
jgi:hypothetical protein